MRFQNFHSGKCEKLVKGKNGNERISQGYFKHFSAIKASLTKILFP